MKFKIFTTIYITILLVLGLTLILVSHAQAQTVNIIDVDFEYKPLFSEANIIPGDSVTRWIKVTNKVNESIVINTSAINVDDFYKLGDVLNIVIKKDGVPLYQNTLSAFFHATSTLSSLAIGETAQYDYTVSFDSQAGNAYQNKTLMFDITVNAQVSELKGNSNVITSSYGGGGSFLTSILNPVKNKDVIVKGESAEPELTINKTVDRKIANPEDRDILYKIYITNNGNLTAYSVMAKDVLPDGLIFMDIPDKQTREWDIGDIKPGEIKEINYRVIVSAQAKSKIYTNLLTVSALNHKEITDSVDLDVRSIKVLGIELASTGFKLLEFLFLIFLIIILLSFSIVLRKYIKRIN
jgi:uncharacterized repeat protein (TIGR01451 family)